MPIENASMGDVFQDALIKTQNILRSEIQLAKTELKEEGTRAGKAAAILGGGSLLACYAGWLLLLTCFFALSIVLPYWLSALILAVLVGIPAAIAVNRGINKLRGINPRPERTIRSLRENVQWAKHQLR